MAVTPARGRETRLLVVTLTISALMLLLLARLRFPDESLAPAPEPAAPPLERLAARATYDELAGILRGLERQVADAILPVRVVAAPAGNDSAPAFAPAVRISDERAVVLLDADHRLPDAAANGGWAVLAKNAPRGIAVLRTPADAHVVTDSVADTPLRAPGYLAGVEATRSGPAVRPLYYGRADLVHDPRWPGAVHRLAGLQQLLPAGAAVFTLEGRFVGLGMPDGRDLLVVPAAALRLEAQRLERDGSIEAADLGLEVQQLDPGLRAASGAETGVMITYVSPRGPTNGTIAPGDVLTRIGGSPVNGAAAYSGAVMQLVPGQPVAIDMRRAGVARTVTVVPAAAAVSAPDADLGLDLRAVPGAGSEVVRVTPRSAAALGGIEDGDLITAAGPIEAPSPAQITVAFRNLASGSHLLVLVERRGGHRALVIDKL